MVRVTLKQLAQFCAVYNTHAVIDGDAMIAHVYDNSSDLLCCIVWLA